MPAFWGYPPPPHDYPYHWVILDPKSKEDKVKVTNLKNSPKFQILKRALYMTHLLKLLDKMCKYEMDPMSIVKDTERTRFCPQTDRRTDRRTDGQGDTSIPPFQLRIIINSTCSTGNIYEHNCSNNCAFSVKKSYLACELMSHLAASFIWKQNNNFNTMVTAINIIQCGAIITQSIFSKISSKDIP